MLTLTATIKAELFVADFSKLPYEEVTVVEKPFNISVTISELVTQTFPITVEVTDSPRRGLWCMKQYPPLAVWI